MDTSDPQIAFDDLGRCNHCIEFFSVRAAHQLEGDPGDEQLGRIVDELKIAGKGRDYDCLVGMSGGVDSTYALDLMHQMGLRPLAMHMDNGWDSEESVSNIRQVTAALGVDYQSYVLDWEEFRDLQLAFLKASVPEAETPTDVAIAATLHRVAADHGIRYIVSAGNQTTEGILPRAWHYNAKDLKYLTYIHKKFGRRPLGKFPTFDFKSEVWYKLVKGINMAYPINYVRFSRDEIRNLLEEKFGYKPTGEKHHESRYTRFIQGYYLYEKFGIDYRRARASSEICSGQITRDAALEKLTQKPYSDETITLDKQYVAKKLDITLDELESIIAAPPKWYWDYPNDEKKLQFIYRLYLRVTGKDKLANF